MSAGNHAQGVSLACKLLKIKAVIVMLITHLLKKLENLELEIR